MCIQATVCLQTEMLRDPETSQVLQIPGSTNISNHVRCCFSCAARSACKPGHSCLGHPDPGTDPGLQQLITEHWQSSLSLHQNTNRKSSHSLKEQKEKHPLARASCECHSLGVLWRDLKGQHQEKAHYRPSHLDSARCYA